MMVFAMLSVPKLEIPPPLLAAELPEKVELETVRVLKLKLAMPPPPYLVAELPEKVELETVRLPDPPFKMPPPTRAVFPEIVELETVRIPELLIPPP